MDPRFEMPKNYYFGGGGETFLTPFAIALLIVSVILIFALPRKYVIAPLLIACMLLPQELNIIVAGLHFPIERILLLAGWLRCLTRAEFLPRLNSLDKVILLWAAANAVTFALLWGAMSAVTNRLGFLYTNVGSYLLLRILIRDKADVIRAIKVFAVIVIIIAPCMMAEHITRHNEFSFFGAKELSEVRDGSVRAEGPFAHPIIAGTVGGMLMPLFVGLWCRKEKGRVLAGLGVVGATMMTIASNSSTPLMTFAAGTLALLLWRARKQMRIFRWGFVILLVCAQLVMKAPVWFLIAHVGGQTGGSGYHRAALIDNFVRHFTEWWLIGTRNNADWGYYMWDVDNAYVAAGVGGGLITFILFIAILVYAYKRIGMVRKLSEKSRNDAYLAWAIGAALFANTVAFFGIFYFDQSIIAWYALLVMVAVSAKLVPPKKTSGTSADVTSANPLSQGSQVLTPA
ncbi:MAG: hypothetical protein WBS24_01770 [Terriglobales bacterium]